MMPPEDDPRDDAPIDREEWEAAMGNPESVSVTEPPAYHTDGKFRMRCVKHENEFPCQICGPRVFLEIIAAMKGRK